jgi:hypothetical protein
VKVVGALLVHHCTAQKGNLGPDFQYIVYEADFRSGVLRVFGLFVTGLLLF